MSHTAAKGVGVGKTSRALHVIHVTHLPIDLLTDESSRRSSTYGQKGGKALATLRDLHT